MTKGVRVGVLELPGAALAYDVVGEAGPLAVQLHGLTSSRRRDAELGLDVGRALTRCRVLRYDARGHGASTGDVDADSYRWDRLADDLLALLDVLAPGERVHGVGPSMGTGTLLHAAVRDPARFASLTLLIPPTAGPTRVAQAETYRRNAALVEREGVGALVALGQNAPVPPALADAPETYPAVEEALLPTVLRGAASTDLPPADQLRGIAAPTLVLAWSGDAAHPLSTAERLRELVPATRMVVARAPHEVVGWGSLVAEHIARAAV
jgi:3-oxoadipate enol-lactonase